MPLCNSACQTDSQDALSKPTSRPKAQAVDKQDHLPNAVSFVDSLPGLDVGQRIPETAAAGVPVPVQSAAAGL